MSQTWLLCGGWIWEPTLPFYAESKCLLLPNFAKLPWVPTQQSGERFERLFFGPECFKPFQSEYGNQQRVPKRWEEVIIPLSSTMKMADVNSDRKWMAAQSDAPLGAAAACHGDTQ